MAADAREVAETYFAAIGARDLDRIASCWAPDGVDNIVGQAEAHGPDGVRTYFAELFDAVPDFAMAVDDVLADGDRAAVLWHAEGTFAGDSAYQGIAPIGMLPAQGSGAEAKVLRAFNARTRVARSLAGGGAEPVAEGVWRVRGGIPRKMNVYLIEDDGGGVTVFDAGVQNMTGAIAAAASALGGINRVVLGHAHVDHRGAAPGLGAPVFCHPDERHDAEGDGGMHYFDLPKLRPYARPVFPYLLRFWDGGPVPVAGTVGEGEDVSGFRVVHLPGHAPGLIALYRERDGLALTSDCFYALDPQSGIHGPPRVPPAPFNLDTEQARASIRKLAGLAPSSAWPGHAEPLTGDVAAQLEHAAATT